MSDVVPFPDSPEGEERRRHAQALRAAGEAEERRRAQEEAAKQEQRRLRLERIWSALEQRPRMVPGGDLRQVARNLWDILHRLEKSAGISKAKVLVDVGKARPEDSTKHLPRYAMRPGLSEAEETKRTKNLVRKAAVYKNIAEAAAKRGGLDPDDVLLELFAGTRYESDLPPDHAEDPAWRAADMIAEGLRRITERLAQKYDLKHYFDVTERQRLVPSSERGEHPEMIATVASLAELVLPARQKHEDAAALERCPGLHLGSCVSSDPVSSLIFLKVAPLGSFAEGIRKEYLGDQPVQAVIVCAGYCTPTSDVTLRIGPVGPAGSIEPFLVLHERTRICPAFHLSVAAETFMTDEDIKLFNDMTGEGEYPDHAVPVWGINEGATFADFTGHQTEPNFYVLNNNDIYNEGDNVSINIAFYLFPQLEAHQLQEEIRLLKYHCNKERYIQELIDINDTPLKLIQHLICANNKNIMESFFGWWLDDSGRPAIRSHPRSYLSIEAQLASAEQLRTLLCAQIFRRDGGPASPAHQWRDERPRKYEGGFRTKREVARLLGSPPLLTPVAAAVTAPEGTLLALLERWLRGDLENKQRLELDLEAEVSKAIEALDVTLRSAKSKLISAAYGDPKAPIAEASPDQNEPSEDRSPETEHQE